MTPAGFGTHRVQGRPEERVQGRPSRHDPGHRTDDAGSGVGLLQDPEPERGHDDPERSGQVGQQDWQEAHLQDCGQGQKK